MKSRQGLIGILLFGAVLSRIRLGGGDFLGRICWILGFGLGLILELGCCFRGLCIGDLWVLGFVGFIPIFWMVVWRGANFLRNESY